MEHHHSPSPVLGRAAPSILVVDDDPLQQTVIAHHLDGAGFNVVYASNGTEALDVARRDEPDLVVLDALMPEMDGFGMLKVLRQDPALEMLPTLMVSGCGEPGARLRAFAAGVDDFIDKPVDGDDLIARVRAQLRVAQAWHGRFHSMVTTLRGIRKRIIDADHGRTPHEVARALVELFPPELACSSFVAVDRSGVTSWSDRPDDARLVERCQIDVDAIPGRPITVAFDTSGRCPLCGRHDGGSDVSFVPAGSWNGGAALLLVGCARLRQEADAELIAEVAEASSVVVSKKMREGPADERLERWLDHLIETAAFDTWFQPIVDMRNGRVVAHEALARFHDGSSPTHVFTKAAALGRTEALDLALIETAIRNAVSLADGARLHLNVSPLTAVTPGLSELVDRSDRRVVLEITEGELFSADSARDLRLTLPIGTLLAADDVGIGYSGLKQLLDVQPDILKIDRSVIVGLHTDPARQALVAGLVRFAESTNSMIIGEGIESADVARALLGLGVTIGQGYHFSRAVPLAQASSKVVYEIPSGGRRATRRQPRRRAMAKR